MPIITITYHCGHSDRRRVAAHSGEYWQQRGLTELCPDCWRAQQNQQAAEAAQTQGLPLLHGTPRQVEWAETLRQAMLVNVADIEAKIPTTDPNRPTWDRLVRKLLAQTSASWWIDQRGVEPLSLFRRWDRERLEAERTKPVSELLGEPASSQTTATALPIGFQHPTPHVPQELRPAAHLTTTESIEAPHETRTSTARREGRGRHIVIDPLDTAREGDA